MLEGKINNSDTNLSKSWQIEIFHDLPHCRNPQMPPQKSPELATQQIAQTEVAVSALRDAALEHLLKEGKATSSTSLVTKGTGGLEIKTTDDQTHAASNTFITIPEMHGNGLTSMGGDTTLTNLGTKKSEKDHIDLSYSAWDDFVGREDTGHVALTRTDAAGHVIQTAAGDYNKFDHGHTAANVTEVDYKVHDARLGDFKLNQVVTNWADGSTEYRSVIRDNTDHILGVVDQNFKKDANGDLISVNTLARKSKYQGQVMPADQ